MSEFDFRIVILDNRSMRASVKCRALVAIYDERMISEFASENVTGDCCQGQIFESGLI